MPGKGLIAVRAALDMEVRKPAVIRPIAATFLASHVLALRGSLAFPTAVFKLLLRTLISFCKVATVPAQSPSASALENAAASVPNALVVHARSTAKPLASCRIVHAVHDRRV